MIIATRVLKLRDESGDTDVSVRLFAPEEANDGSWWCQYEIDWPEGLWTMKAGGADSIQAVVLALHMIGSEIYTSNYHKSGNLILEAPGQGYGFPVPYSLRYLLIGDDAKFF